MPAEPNPPPTADPPPTDDTLLDPGPLNELGRSNRASRDPPTPPPSRPVTRIRIPDDI